MGFMERADLYTAAIADFAAERFAAQDGAAPASLAQAGAGL